MTFNAILYVLLIVGGSALLSWPLGRYLKWAMDPAASAGGGNRWTRAFQAIGGPLTLKQQNWKQYLLALLAFNAVSFTVTVLILALQQYLPLNPDAKGELDPSLIFNTAVSFVTNTNLQHYSGEVAMSYASQLGALMWQQFVSAATGIAALAAMARGLAGRTNMGNFFVDLQRATFLILLPLAILVAILLVFGGMPMTLQGSAIATTLEGIQQTIARGPVAAFTAIKQLGTNGGGFFGPNSTQPFENPTFWTNVLEAIAITIIPMACVWMFGRIVGKMRHAGIVFVVMAVLMLTRIGFAVWFEQTPTEAFNTLPIAQNVGNLEGKELRFGAAAGPVWAVLTTSTSNGSVNAMLDSLNPLTGLMPMIGMWLNEDFGGVGVGFINMFVYIVLAVFLAGMMVGRTPEYLGRRIEAYEVKLAVIATLSHSFLILGLAALFAATPWGTAVLNNVGAHGFSEILYEFSSSSANNGSGFEGINDTIFTVPWNIATGLVMMLSRFIPIILPLAIAGSLAAKRPAAESAGTLGTESGTFGVMLLVTIVILGALTFFPAAALGPIAEHFQFYH
ncbi:MAG: potassium-transporting ATPase, subunit [Devosia sp.]|uniref:potassium-transporting ATPase subunit KdpA n=1 Tax=Devosia sp. TaxID=1871048 RepID=UPI002609DEAA|nr:potassium-transporting ATPase subunit KdpA [Devosia sp.]MDB5540784.1 potassium-transporting ATPase, subunit [Devosia sp.]